MSGPLASPFAWRARRRRPWSVAYQGPSLQRTVVGSGGVQ